METKKANCRYCGFEMDKDKMIFDDDNTYFCCRKHLLRYGLNHDKSDGKGTILIITYYKLGNNRYLRALNCEEDKSIFVNHTLNLGFINAESREELIKDFEMVKQIIKREDNKVRISKNE